MALFINEHSLKVEAVTGGIQLTNLCEVYHVVAFLKPMDLTLPPAHCWLKYNQPQSLIAGQGLYWLLVYFVLPGSDAERQERECSQLPTEKAERLFWGADNVDPQEQIEFGIDDK